jgi:hypothetical protein
MEKRAREVEDAITANARAILALRDEKEAVRNELERCVATNFNFYRFLLLLCMLMVIWSYNANFNNDNTNSIPLPPKKSNPMPQPLRAPRGQVDRDRRDAVVL